MVVSSTLRPVGTKPVDDGTQVYVYILGMRAALSVLFPQSFCKRRHNSNSNLHLAAGKCRCSVFSSRDSFVPSCWKQITSRRSFRVALDNIFDAPSCCASSGKGGSTVGGGSTGISVFVNHHYNALWKVRYSSVFSRASEVMPCKPPSFQFR